MLVEIDRKRHKGDTCKLTMAFRLTGSCRHHKRYKKCVKVFTLGLYVEKYRKNRYKPLCIDKSGFYKFCTLPEGEQIIRELLGSWESFLNAEDDIDPLIKVAMAHYQFEAIHLFIDGNGLTDSRG